MIVLGSGGYRGILVGDGDPLDGLDSTLIILDLPVSVRLPPHSPFPLQPYVSQHPAYEREGVFVVDPPDLPSTDPSCNWFSCCPPQHLTASAPPPPVPMRLLHRGPVAPVT